jgi:hypothetical protein
MLIMKKILLTLGCIGLLLIIFAVGEVCYTAIKGQQLDVSSKAYVGANIPTIISSWSEDELLKRASTELQENLAGREGNQFFSKVKQLGKCESYDGCEGQAYINYSLQYGKVITALYTAQAKFQNGNAKIKMELVWRNDQWQIATITVNSPLFPK